MWAQKSDIYQQVAAIQLRHEYSIAPSMSRTGVRVGLDMYGGEDSELYDVLDALRNQYPFVAPAVYGEMTKDIDDLRVVAGLREIALAKW